jgi:ribose 5-phosphate isomerase RpiB
VCEQARVCQTWPVRVYLGSDHAGHELRTRLIEWLVGAGHEPKIFLSTPFSAEPRHARRLAEIADYEKTGELPPLPA